MSNICSVWIDGNCGGGIHIFIDQSGYVIVNIILQIEWLVKYYVYYINIVQGDHIIE